MIKTPTKDGLNQLLSKKQHDVVQLIINENKLPFRILGDEVIDFCKETEVWLDKFITVNKTMLQVKSHVRKLTSIEDPVLIVGPTGTGKELLARALHGNRSGRFIGVNCAGLPSELIESELFGNIAGAFTSASKTRDGLMQDTKDGTLFLDEIGDFPLEVQAKLLRAIQEKVVRKVGSTKEEEINCRIICATHRDLKTMINYSFRIDLYARISTFELDTISLKDRPEDIIPIIQSMKGGEEFLKSQFASGIECFELPLNIRDLQKIVRRYEVLGVI